MSTSREFTYQVHWSNDDAACVATVVEFPSLSWVAETPAEAMAGVVQLVDEVLADLQANGDTPPVRNDLRRHLLSEFDLLTGVSPEMVGTVAADPIPGTHDWAALGLRFKMTCPAAPEQYDVFDATGEEIGYVRLRHGELRGERHGIDVLHKYFSDAAFGSDNERSFYLGVIAQAILGSASDEVERG
jgi:predicted RNase H-like HicB family nuclease